MVVSAAGQTGEVTSFADRLGERFVVAQPSGALLESLVFHPGLSSAAFFESAVRGRLKRLSNFRHAAYTRVTRLQRDPARGNRLTMVSSYSPGRRLADILVLARRGKLQPPVGAVLSLTRQLMTGAALLHDYAPDVFHGALGPERIVVGADGRLTITEYVLGTAIEQAVTEWGVPRVWRECRIAAIADTALPRFGRRLDLLQIGVVALSLLLGRPLADGDFPGKLTDLLDGVRESEADGTSAPLGESLRDWLGKTLCLDPSSAFRTLIEAQKALNRLVEDEPRYAGSNEAVEAFVRHCEDVGPLAVLESGPATRAHAGVLTPDHATQAVVAAATGAEPTESKPGAATPPEADAAAVMPATGQDVAATTPVPQDVPAAGQDVPAVEHEEPATRHDVPVAQQDAPAAASLPATAAAALETAPPPVTTPTASPAAAVTPDAPPAVDSAAVAEMLALLKPLEAPATDEEFSWRGGTDPAPFPQEPADARARTAVTPESASNPPAAGVTPAATFEITSNVWEVGGGASPKAASGPAPVAPAAAFEITSNVWEVGAASSPKAASGPAPIAPQSTASRWSESFTPSPEPANPDPARPAAADTPAPAETSNAATVASGERRAVAVLSYEEVHRNRSAPRRSKAPFLWAAAAVLVLAVAGLVGGPKAWTLMKGPDKPADEGRPAGPTEPGGFKITTQPPGSRLSIDGVDRGKSPLTVNDLAPGLHSIVVESEWGRLEEAVTVEAGKVVPLALATVGWIKVVAPVELEVSEDGRVYGQTAGTIMVPAGRHAFIFSNKSVAIRHRQFVQVPAGETVKVPLDLPHGVLNLTSDQPAQVLLDGELIGEAPQVSVPASLGPHQVVFRSARLGDVSYSVNVTLAAPVSLSANFGARR